jgi:hypothetical protein
MLNNYFIRILFTALFISSVFFLMGQSRAYAQISGIHEHTDMQHVHTMRGEEVIADIKTDPERILSEVNKSFVFLKSGGNCKELSIHHDRILYVMS